MYSVVALFMYFIGFVVVVCVISEAAGKTVDRQKGKAVVGQKDRGRWEDGVLHASAMHRCRKIVRLVCFVCNLFPERWRG